MKNPCQKVCPKFCSHQLIEDVTEALLTIEDFLGSRRVQRLIIAQVTTIAELLAQTPAAEDDAYNRNIDCVVSEPLVSVSLFEFMIDTNRLPEFGCGKRIIYQLVSNHLKIDIMPSLCHDNAAASFTNDLLRWSESGGVLDCLENGLAGCTIPLYLSLTSLAWLYDGGSKKSPDNSFTPTNLESPPAKTIGASNVLYPNFPVEVGKSHESWDQLSRDANEKHFAPITDIVLYLGIKIYPTKRMRGCLLERDTVQGSGYLNPPVAQTGFIDINVPCNITIVVPKRLLFFGFLQRWFPPR
jgi:hypothetical protein